MFYAMKQIPDTYNPKLFHVRAIRITPFKSFEAAKKAAKKEQMGYVINQKREVIYV